MPKMRRAILGLIVLLFPGSLWAGWGVVQQSESTFVQGTTVTAQFPGTTNVGDLVLAQVVWSDTTISVTAIGDTRGNTFTSAALAQGTTSSLAISNQLFYATNATGGTDKISVTISGTAFLSIFIYDIAGATTNPLDVTAVGQGIGFSVSTASAITGTANEFVFVGTAHHFAYDTPGAGFTGIQGAETGLGEYQIVSTAGTSVVGTDSLTATSSGYPWAVILAAFKPLPSSTGGGPTLSSIQVSPFSPTLSMSQTQQFTAMGTYSDGSTQDLTSSATWSTSNSVVATINSSGFATATGHGTTTITATSGSVSGSTTLTVEGTLSSIQVTPVNYSITAGTTQQFTATGTFSDSTTENITGSVNWTSSNTAVATVNSSGLATGIASGNTTITATASSVTASTSLGVTQPAGGGPAVVKTPLVQQNFEWFSSYFVQHPPAAGGGDSCSPAPCIAQTFLNANTAGNLIFVWVSWNTGGFSLSGLSDSAGNSYTHVPGFPVLNANGIADDFWVAYNIAASPSNKVLATFGNGATKNTYLQIMEFTGLATSNALDVHSNVSRQPTCTAPCILSSAASPTTAQSSELVVSVFDMINCGSSCSAVQYTDGAGWTEDVVCTGCVGWSGQDVSGAVLVEHQVVSTIGSYTATAVESITSNPNYDSYLFTFKRVN